MQVIHKRDLILAVRDRWKEQYGRDPQDRLIGPPGRQKPIGDTTKRLAALDLATCSESDVDAAIGVDRWAANECDECGANVETLVRFGMTPDYDARWQDLCGNCLAKAVTTLATTSPKE